MSNLQPTQLFKYQAEQYGYIAQFNTKQVIIDGDTLASAGVITWLPNDGGLTVGAGTVSGSTVIFNISGGTVGENYLITVVATTTGAATLICEGYLLIRA